MSSENDSDTNAYRIAYCDAPEARNEAADSEINRRTAKQIDLIATDDNLRAVVDAWQHLPEAIKAGIMAMVRAASG